MVEPELENCGSGIGVTGVTFHCPEGAGAVDDGVTVVGVGRWLVTGCGMYRFSGGADVELSIVVLPDPLSAGPSISGLSDGRVSAG